MKRQLCKFALWTLGWKAVDPPAPEDKVVILGVPHTSTFDFLISYLYYTSVGGKAHIMIKEELFIGPLGWLLKKLGGLPINRKNPTTIVLSVIREMNNSQRLHLAIAPEGSRKPTKRWKTGFHTIAKETGAAVYLGYFNWAKKEVGRGQKVELTDNAREDMQRIQKLYEGMKLGAKHPDGYITG